MKMEYADCHLHSNPIKGMGAALIAKKFKESGGWFMALVMLPTWDYGELARNLEEYKRMLEVHVRECEKAREAGLKISCFAGLHPAEIEKLMNAGKKPLEVREYGFRIIDLLFRECGEGRIQGIGEIGRQHYKVKPEVLLITEDILEYILEKNRDYECPLQLHTENVPRFTAYNIAEVSKRVGSPIQKILLHHASPSVVADASKNGLWTTTPARLEPLRIVLQKVFEKILLETDFIDSPYSRAPGPWMIPVVLSKLLEEGVVDEDYLYRLNVSDVEKFFDVEY
jgi:TatD-related deoxyribonuclease